MRPRKAKTRPTLRHIAHEWDRMAGIRARQITEHRDLTYDTVLYPTIRKLIRYADTSRTLDAGCGTGVLTMQLASSVDTIIGVDISDKSISVARDRASESPNATFVRSSVEAYATRVSEPFTLAIANMTLMTTPNLKRFLEAISLMLAEAGTFIFTVTHPWFWPAYWGYDKEPWFDYSSEVAITAPFKISLETSQIETTHFHRPLAQYFKAFHIANLAVHGLYEPLPRQHDEQRYPAPWKYPRILAGRCVTRTKRSRERN